MANMVSSSQLNSHQNSDLNLEELDTNFTAPHEDTATCLHSTRVEENLIGHSNVVLKDRIVDRLLSLEYDSDEEPPVNKENPLWSLPPEDSYSDWTIEIFTVNNTERDHKVETNTYHVHKGILAAGPRKCEYFSRLFLTEKSTGSTRMELHELAAMAFPAMLNFMYLSSLPLEITTETAIALHALGTFFENKRLRWDAKHFYKNDISFSNCHVYYEHARIFENDKVLEQIARTCGQGNSILNVHISSPFVMVADAEFWPSVLAFANMKEETSRHASRIIYQVIKARSADLDLETFERLTDERYLPYIDVNVASHFLDAHECFRATDDDNALTSLQKRCVDVIAQNWLRLSSAANRSDFLSRQKPLVLAELLDQILQRAGDTVTDYKKALDKMRNRSSKANTVSKTASERDRSESSNLSRDEDI